MRGSCQPEWLPHVHNGKTNARTLARAEPAIELTHACFRAVLAAEPDRPTAIKVAHYDPAGVALADRNLVDANRPRCRRAGTLKLRLHILHLKRFDGVPVEPQLRSNVLDCRIVAAPADVIGEALGIEGVVGQKVEPLALHLATAATVNPPYLQFKENPRIATRQIADPAHLAVVPAHLDMTATAARRFFDRRLSVITRAFGSPKIPRTVGSG